MVNQVFHVLTEFRFDVAHAVAGSDTLQGELGKISSAADQAHYSLKRAAMGFVVQMGAGTGGFLGFLYNAMKSADKFYKSQLQMSNILMSNGLVTGANAFRDSMAISEKSMENMAKISRKFGLPADVLAESAKGIGAVLTLKHMDDAGFTKSTDLARAFLKSAPVLNVDPAMYQQNLLDLVMGQGSMGDRMTQRLVMETQAFAPFKGSLKGFNAKPAADRLKILTDALDQFSNSAEINNAMVHSLSGQLQTLRDYFFSIFSLLRPIGKALNDAAIKILMVINAYLEKNGDRIAKTLGRILDSVIKDPMKFYLDLQQLRKLREDTQEAGRILAAVGMIAAVGGLMKWINFLPGLGSAMLSFSEFFSPALNMSMFASVGMLGKGFMLLRYAISSIVAPLLALTFLFQAMSRGAEKAKVINAKWFADNLPALTELFEKVKNNLRAITAPITMAIEGISEFFAFIFRMDIMGDFLLGAATKFNSFLEFWGRWVVGILSIVAGFTNTLIGFAVDLSNGKFLDAFKNIPGNFVEGMTDLYKKYYPNQAVDINNQATSQANVKIDNITIKNDFKENAEPDRIAFTLTEQIKRIATNSLSARGRTLNGASIGN